MVGAERLRQINVEGFVHAHDNRLGEGVLSAAADCYLYLTHAVDAPENMRALIWPLHPGWFKPAVDPRRNMVKAAALYLAEGERYDRMQKPDQAERCRLQAARIAKMIDEMQVQ